MRSHIYCGAYAVRLHYNHLGAPRTETFNFRLADGAWHRLAVTVSGGVASLYIDCRRVERRWMAAIPDTAITPESSSLPAAKEGINSDKMSLWIGQRGDQHFLFKVKNRNFNLKNRNSLYYIFYCCRLKGAMQDVKLVAGSNGHLVQCPAAEAECPTCGEFHSLQSVVARLEKSLLHLTNKVRNQLLTSTVYIHMLELNIPLVILILVGSWNTLKNV